MSDTSFNAIQISINEIRMKQLVNNSNINFLSDKIQSIERTMLNSENWHQSQIILFQQQNQQNQHLNTQLYQQSMFFQNKLNNIEEQLQRVNNQMFNLFPPDGFF